MPIYDQAYRKYEAREGPRHIRFWPITREALRLTLAKRAFIGLMVLSFIPFVIRVVQVYVVTRFPEAGRVLPVDGRLFGEFLNQQIGFTILLSIFGGAGLVANDLRTGAILVYLSRPLTRRDYVLGKLGVTLGLEPRGDPGPRPPSLRDRPGPRSGAVHEVESRLDPARGRRACSSHLAHREPPDPGRLRPVPERPRRGPGPGRGHRGPRDRAGCARGASPTDPKPTSFRSRTTFASSAT